MKKTLVNHIRHLLINGKMLMLIILLILGTYIPINAQSKSVTIQTGNTTLKQVINEIEKQTNYLFVYDNADIDTNKAVHVKVKNGKVEQILTDILKDTDIAYTVENRNILLMKKSEKKGVHFDQALVRGTVKDVNGDPLIGVTIKEKGTQNGIMSDSEGSFSIGIQNGRGMLSFSYLGFTSVEKSADANNLMAIVLQEDVKALDEVVVTGYMTQKKGLLTGSIVSMNVSDEMSRMAVTSAAELLVGQMAGVNVSTQNGVPGSNANIQIRTKSSWREDKDLKVLFVIDGVVSNDSDFNNLSPNEIENITVLKDAASAAVYGSRSANGVILVTTKRGAIGKPVFNYSYSYGIESRTKNAERTTAVEAGELYNRIHGSVGWWWGDDELDYMKTINNGNGYDHLDIVWRSPSKENHNFSVNGGSEKVKYFAGLSYAKEKSFLESMDYKKMNFRLNMTVDLTNDLELFAGMSLSDNRRNDNQFEGADVYKKLLLWQPDQPIYTDGGQYAFYDWIANTGAEVNKEGGYKVFNFMQPRMQFNVNYKAPFLKGLSFKAGYAQRWTNDRTREFRKFYNMAVLKREGSNAHIYRTEDDLVASYRRSTTSSEEFIKQEASWAGDYQINAQVNFDRTFKDVHNIQGVFAFERSQSDVGGVTGQRNTFPVYLTDEFWAASSDNKHRDADGKTVQKNGRASFIGQFAYSYANKYLTSFSFREDGSMNFDPDHRWGFFPAATIGWVISEENFFKKDLVEFLKIRASVGLTGNDAVGSYQWQETYKNADFAHFGTTPSSQAGIRYNNIVNNRITWEKTLSYNVAVDMNFLKNWNTTVEYWNKDSYDILGNIGASLPITFTRGMPDENYGKMQAQGFDFSLGYRNRTKDWSYRANLTLSYGWNKVKKESYSENAKWYDIPIGRSKSKVVGYHFDKIIRSEAELNNFMQNNPNYEFNGKKPKVGDMVYKDISGEDGTPDGIIDSWDKDILIANRFPIVYGLSLGGSWKGISVEMMFSGKLNEKKGFSNLRDGVDHNRMWKKWHNDSWTEDNPNAMLPKRVSNDKTYNEESMFWYKDASYIRLKNLNVSYTLPKVITGKVLDNAKIYFTGTNLFVLSKFNYYDPEGGAFDYPIMRTFNFGVNVTF